jgi:hypothetical protein
MSTRSRAKQRVTFRVDPELAGALRHLPNQTAFVERVLREALGRLCPVCAGSGEVPDVHLAVSNLKKLAGRRLERDTAAQLKALVRLGRQLLATNLRLAPRPRTASSVPLALRTAAHQPHPAPAVDLTRRTGH